MLPGATDRMSTLSSCSQLAQWRSTRSAKVLFSTLTIIILISIALQFTTFSEQLPSTFSTDRSKLNSSSFIPRILFWTRYFGAESFSIGLGDGYFRRSNCSFICTTTANKNELSESDAILFHTRDAYLPLPRTRRRHPKWVFFSYESPYSAGTMDARIDKKFNWMMTYFGGSDVVIPYGRYRRRASLQQAAAIDWNKKNKTAAWVVSHCKTPSGRELLFERLREFIHITRYGECNNEMRCQGSGTRCYWELAEEHLFYLSWENALCEDYVTEKAWDAMAAGLVPVVYGGADYDQLLPPHSFIDALSFTNVEQMASYLIYLQNNHTAYEEYLHWQQHYEIVFDFERGWCQLCEKLHQERVHPTSKHVILSDTWTVKRMCSRRTKDKDRLLLESKDAGH